MTATASASIASRYFVTTIATPGIGDSSLRVWGISNRGQVVGGATSGGYPFVWTPDRWNGVDTGTTTQLTMPRFTGGPTGEGGSYTSGAAWGINDHGQIAGYAGVEQRALLWQPDTLTGPASYRFVELFANGTTRAAYAAQINNRGQIVGASSMSGGPRLWNPTEPNGTTFTSVSLATGTTQASRVFTINEAGDIAGNNFFWRPSQPNGTTGVTVSATNVWDMNDAGLAVGGHHAGTVAMEIGLGATPAVTHLAVPSTLRALYGVNNSSIAVEGFGHAWDIRRNVTARLLDRLETHSGRGIDFLRPRSINNMGQIAGTAQVDHDQNPATPVVTHAVLLTPLIDGDVNIDQRVDFADLLIFAGSYRRQTDQRWHDGDFDGNGAVDFADLLLLAQNYRQQGQASSATLPNEFAGDWHRALSLVPEPTTTAVAAFVLGLLTRRRR